MHLPSDLIIGRFNLSTQCYEPDCRPDPQTNSTLHRIVDGHGQSSGFDTPIRRMLAELSAAGA